MAITTWAELIESPNSEKRYIVFMATVDVATGLVLRTFYFSNIEGSITGLSFLFHGNVKTIPRLSRKSTNLTGAIQAPAWTDLVLFREDGQDVSSDFSGITLDDFGRTWTAKDRAIQVYFGGEDLPFSEYKMIFHGTTNDQKFNNQHVTFDVQGFENQAQQRTIGNLTADAVTYPNAQTNVDKPLPHAIGLCFGVKPLCVDFVAYTYSYHDNTTAGTLVAVYQDGVGLTPGPDYINNGNGTFSLLGGFNPPTGLITAFAIGTFAGFGALAQAYLTGFAGIPLGQIDTAAMTALDIALPYNPGFYVTSKTGVWDVLAKLSVGYPMQYFFTRTGIFTASEFTDPVAATIDYYVSEDGVTSSAATLNAILRNTLSGTRGGNIIYSVEMEYYENFTPISEDRASPLLTPTQKAVIAIQWRKVPPVSTPGILTVYPNAGVMKAQLRDTTAADATAVGGKWLALLGQERYTISLKIKTMDLTIDLSDIIEVTFETELRGATNYRHNLNGTRLRVIGIVEDYTKKEITLTLWG